MEFLQYFNFKKKKKVEKKDWNEFIELSNQKK